MEYEYFREDILICHSCFDPGNDGGTRNNPQETVIFQGRKLLIKGRIEITQLNSSLEKTTSRLEC